MDYLEGMLPYSSSERIISILLTAACFLFSTFYVKDFSFWNRLILSIFLGYQPLYWSNVHKYDGYILRWFQELKLWNMVSNFLRAEIQLETALDSKKQYIFCNFPHGASSVNALFLRLQSLNTATRYFMKICRYPESCTHDDGLLWNAV